MMEGLTAHQKTCMAELRKRVEGMMQKELFEDDNMFLRFLIARDYNLDAAEVMLKNHLNWRKRFRVDTILKDYTAPEITQFLPLNKLGFSKTGMPITFVSLGTFDTKGILKVLKKNEVEEYIIHNFEGDIQLMKQQTEELGRPITQFIYVFDLNNFSLATATHKPTLDVLSCLVGLFDRNYPERLHSAYIVNAQFYFSIFWSVFSPFIPGNTAKKIKMFGKDGWKSELLKEIDEDVLPAFLGGTRSDPDGDPFCKSFIRFGGVVPSKYFRRRSTSLAKIPGTRKITVHRMSKETVELHVLKPDSVVEWDFEVKSKDINFSLLRRAVSDNIDVTPKEIIPKQRIDTVISSETGMYKCEKAGIYILEFDNTYSWMHSKEIYYNVNVLRQEEALHPE